MTARRPVGWLEPLVRSGEYHRLAAQSTSDADLAARLGTTADSIGKARQRLRAAGMDVPTVQEVQHQRIGSLQQQRIADVSSATPNAAYGVADDSLDFDEEPPTLPGIPVDVVPQRHIIKGVSSFVVDGEVRGQWIKTTAQNDERAEWLEAIRNLSADRPRVEPIAPPAHSDEDLLVVLPVGDPHVGLHAWHRDAGENFNLDIAKRNLIAAFQHLIALAPAAAKCLIVFIGDNSHVDSQSNTTTAGTRQDADSRTIKIAETLIEIERYAIDLALAKFGDVYSIIERGNHDDLLSAMNALALSYLYEKEPRVHIDTSPEHYHWMRFGQNLIGTHHGDKAKPETLLGVMACDRAKDWGETRHRRFYCGHVHHQVVKEMPGMIVEYLPTLASSDAWHRSMGYRSGRAMYMDVLHREHGHINRHIVGIRQLTEAA